MATSTQAILYIPFPVTNSQGADTIESTHLTIPSDLQGWAKHLVESAEAFDSVSLR